MSYNTEDYLEGYEHGLQEGLRQTRSIEKLSLWLGIAVGSVAVLLTIVLSKLLG